MRTIKTKVYNFNELTKDAQQNAIEQVRQKYYKYNDFGEWAINDCALLEPPHKELHELFGDAYDFPLIENTRENIYFSTDRNWYLDCAKAMKVTNDERFLKWLGIDRNVEGLGDITFTIFTSGYINASTSIDFDDYSSDFDDLIFSAQKKFNQHIKDCLKRIEADIDYRFTDEAIKEDIEANEYEFLSDGTIYL